MLPEIGGTIHTQSAGHPPRARSCKKIKFQHLALQFNIW